MRSFLVRAAALFRRRTLDVDFDDEVQFDEMLAQEHMQQYRPQTRVLPHLETFGGVTQMKESYREQRGLPSVEMFLQDTRYGIRGLLRAGVRRPRC